MRFEVILCVLVVRLAPIANWSAVQAVRLRLTQTKGNDANEPHCRVKRLSPVVSNVSGGTKWRDSSAAQADGAGEDWRRGEGRGGERREERELNLYAANENENEEMK